MDYSFVATNEGVFAYMQMLLKSEAGYRDIPGYIKDNFVLLRTHAENLARHYYGKDNTQGITMKQVYEALSMSGGLVGEAVNKLILLERRTLSELHMKDGLGEVALENDKISLVPWIEEFTDDFSVQILAGTSIRTIGNNKFSGAAEIGAGLGGPILIPYVEWFLQMSEKLGFKRLYFIARDGYILKRMADILIHILGLDIKTHYIYGSRRAWRIPSYMGEEGDIKVLLRCSYIQYIHTIDDLSDVLQIPVEKLLPYLPEEYRVKGQNLEYAELAYCVYRLEHNAVFREFFKEYLSEDRSLVQEYIKQEVDVEDEHFAFVELAGGGDTQICLSKLMSEFYDGPIYTFYYKMDKVRSNDGKCIFYDFFPSRLKNHLIIEMVCRAPEGQTEGYRRERDKVVPVIKDDEGRMYRERGYKEYIRGIEAFTKAYAEVKAKFRPAISIKASLACMKYLLNHQDSNADTFFAGLPNSATGREQHLMNFAPPLTKRQVQDFYIRKTGFEALASYQGTDFGMSVSNSPLYLQHKVKKYAKEGKKIRQRWLKLFPGADVKQLSVMEGLKPWSQKGLGKRVVLYGAGKWGFRWYEELCADSSIEVVQWLDRDYRKINDKLPVNGGLDSLGKVSYDWIMIGVGRKETAEEIKAEIMSKGVSETVIYEHAFFIDWLTAIKNYMWE